jgi:hypothetical protein
MLESARKIDIIKDAQELIKVAHSESWSHNYIPLLFGNVLEEEGGVTEISTKNLAVIKKRLGYPICAEVVADGNILFHFLPEHLYQLPTPYLATGFTVGYRGEGPSGLARALVDYWELEYMKAQDFVASVSREYRGVLTSHCFSCHH